jgi:hypothetical protein
MQEEQTKLSAMIDAHLADPGVKAINDTFRKMLKETQQHDFFKHVALHLVFGVVFFLVEFPFRLGAKNSF